MNNQGKINPSKLNYLEKNFLFEKYYLTKLNNSLAEIRFRPTLTPHTTINSREGGGGEWRGGRESKYLS